MRYMWIREEAKIGIRVHFASARNQLKIRYDLICPYCREMFGDLQNLNRHIRNFIFPYLKIKKGTTITAR